MKYKLMLPILLMIGYFVVSCSDKNAESRSSTQDEKTSRSEQAVDKNPNRNLYWGDTHLHTNYSSDAFLFGTIMATPDDAYRFAKGEVMTYPPTGEKIQVKRPLDFLVVTDHAEGLGTLTAARQQRDFLMSTDRGKQLAEVVGGDPGIPMFLKWLRAKNQGEFTFTEVDTGRVMQTIWEEYIAYADQHNDPGQFTSFIGWEWTSTPKGFNLHRVVFSPDDASKASKFLPYSATHSQHPEDLWDWMAETSESLDIDLVAIPHNSNVSGGLMFPDKETHKGIPITADYARTRAQWEPIVEITQIKGTSEAHPAISQDDEFASFEQWDALLRSDGSDRATRTKGYRGDFVRYALQEGMKIEEQVGVNPYKFGVIGSSDTHTALSSVDEDQFTGKNLIDGGAPDKSKPWIADIKHIDFSASGLAAVWAESNTRRDIYDAMQRREVYGTTGPRIQLRVFGGFDFSPEDIEAADYVDRGYDRGVPMGGELMSSSGDPLQLMIAATMDPDGAHLDRVQVIKSWLENGESQEKIYDVAWSGDRKITAGTLPPVGNTVNVQEASYTNDIGAAELTTIWTDPDFDPSQRAVYYVRVLEIPTPRFSTYASAKMGQDPWAGQEPVIQERAYSSPIWYQTK